MNPIEDIDINPPRTIGQRSAETEALLRHLEKAEVGHIITYKEMLLACKADVQAHPSHLNTARRTLLKSRVAFGTIIGIGIKRLDDHEMPAEAKSKQIRARRTAEKGLAILNCADLGKLDPELKVRAITTRTVLSFMTRSGSRKVLNLTEQSVRTSNGDMKVGKIEDLFAR